MSDFFYLKGRENTITAEGIFKWIRTPATDGKDLNGELQSNIRAAFSEANAAGIKSPIIVGAIPFDPAAPSALYIPKEYKIVDQDDTCVNYAGDRVEVVKTEELPEHTEFKSMVSKATDHIRQGSLDKVVLSRLKVIRTREPLESTAILARLIEQYPKGNNFHVPLPDEKTFLIGSSPELLVAKRGTEFYSKPLAGSAPRHPSRDPEKERVVAEKLLASKKDRLEHKVVVDSMRNTLAPRSVELSIPSEPECISTPKLWHLATKVTGRVANLNESGLSLACLLHPTPALSGCPHQVAHELLKELEPFDRRYFGGIVGYSDSDGNGEWYIAIRSGELSGDKLTLFGGAGIVGGSDPESEWQETETKISTMLHAIALGQA